MMYYGLLVLFTVVAIFVRLLDLKPETKNLLTVGSLLIATAVSVLIGINSFDINWRIAVAWFLGALIYVVIIISIVLPKADDTYCYDEEDCDTPFEEERQTRYVPDSSYFDEPKENQHITYIKPQSQKATKPSEKVTTSDCDGFQIEE